MSAAQPHVLLILPYGGSSFMQQDSQILSDHFTTTVYTHQRRNPLPLLRTVVGHLLRGKADVLAMWFIIPSYALPVALLGRLFRRKVVFLTGGYDVEWIPEVSFGTLRIPLARWLLPRTLWYSSLVLTNSNFSQGEVTRWAGFRPRRMATLYHDIDSSHFCPNPSKPKERLAVTVCARLIPVTIPQKGVNTVVEAARLLPDVQFVVVGQVTDEPTVQALVASAGPNLRFAGRVSDAELLDLYQRAGAYVQMSVHEGFGVAVAEAMACGCIPVITDPASYQTSMPEVVGEFGITAPYGDAAAVATGVERALAAGPEQRERARQRVVSRFPLGKRERQFVALIKKITQRGSR